MPQVQVLPNFAEVVHVSSNADDKTISLIFRAEDNQNFAITLPAAESPRLVQILQRAWKSSASYAWAWAFEGRLKALADTGRRLLELGSGVNRKICRITWMRLFSGLILLIILGLKSSLRTLRIRTFFQEFCRITNIISKLRRSSICAK